jgi:hypothetical protein
MGGGVYAVTSEPQTLAREARENWGLSFETIGDPHHEIADELRKRGWLHLVVNDSDADFEGIGTDWRQHPKGYFQPGVIVIARNGRVLYRWRAIPNRRNTGGATHRAIPAHVWSEAKKALALPADSPNAPLDDPPVDRLTPPWPIFVCLLLANGNFLRPRPFPMTRNGAMPTNRFKWVPLKIVAFLAAWGAAFTWLPTSLVLLTVAGWAAWITPSLRHLHRAFQNVKEEDLAGEIWTY